ncbi:MAG: DUF4874 domain-containing protein [Kiritimatiellae bacterium]|nr:DUF4874 domain-containing protein [Kiritimatiellia bacterium]
MKRTIGTAGVLLTACATLTGAPDPKDYFKPEISYSDGAETFAGPARGWAAGGWTVFKPEGLPDWHGAKAYNSSLWELSRFSGGREQGGKRPPPERVDDADIPLTAAMKADVRRYLEETRRNGGSLIVRIGYTWSDKQGCEPSDFDVVLGHVRDLAKIMADFDDVVVGVEAGVAGPWGEMHSSDYCRPEYMNRVLKTYCSNLGRKTSLLVRTANYIAAYAGTKSDGLLAMLPFGDVDLCRFGMYNDGYLGTWWDYGTWAGEWKREKGCRLLQALGDHPYGGELAYVNMDWLEGNRERCGDLFDVEKWNIVKDWYETHLNYLRNVGDRKHPLCAFIADKEFRADHFRFDGMPDLHEYDGLDLHKFMYDHMGWRFVVRDARLPRRLAPGKAALVAMDVENTGFGRLLLPSRMEVVLVAADGAAHAIPASGGLSSMPGGGKTRLAVKFAVPKGLKRGRYGLFVRASAPLRDEKPGGTPRRPIRFANAGMWDDGLKANSFGEVEVR